MKKLVVLLTSLVLCCGLAIAKDHVEKIDASALPEKAQQFINDHLSSYPVKKIVCSTDERGVKEYTVQFKNKLVVEFDMVGAWNEIDARKAKSFEITEAMLPIKVRGVLRSDFAGKKILKVENNGVEYDFSFADKSEAEINSLGTIVEIEK